MSVLPSQWPIVRHTKFNNPEGSPIINNLQIMVRIRDFQGAVFHPEEYGLILGNNIEHLETIPMSKSFNTSEMLAQGKLHPQLQPFFYIYRQVYQNHTSYGILAEISLEDYDQNKIKKHEKTLHRPGLDHSTYLQDHVGPVVVSHRHDQSLNEMIVGFTKSKAIFSEWATNDGRCHSLWRIKESEAALSESFQKIESLYILDGHHRLEAAHRNFQLNDKSRETDLWIQAVIYSSEYVMVHPQHRVIENIPENLEMIHELMKLEHLEIIELEVKDSSFKINSELNIYEIILKIEKKMYGINFKNTSRNVLQKIAAFRLQNEIFREFCDEEFLTKLTYMPGIIKQEELLTHTIIFFVKKPHIQTLFQIADEQISMPPKSTWIEPKPCSHMVIRLIN